MKVCVSGDTSLSHMSHVKDAWLWYGPSGDSVTILHGDDDGADAAAREMANYYGYDKQEYRTRESDPMPRGDRNERMVADSDMVLAVSADGNGKTWNLVKHAAKHGVPFAVHMVDE